MMGRAGLRIGNPNVEVFSAAGLSRLLKHFQEREVAFVSADRSNRSKSENADLEKDLAHTIRGLGYGFIDVTGYWVETGSEPSPEKTFAVINNLSTSEDFIRRMFQLGERYDQTAIMVVNPVDGHAYYYYMSDGGISPDDKGSFTNLESRIREWILDKDGEVSGRGHTRIGNKEFRFASLCDRFKDPPSGREGLAAMRSRGRHDFDRDLFAFISSDIYGDDTYGWGKPGESSVPASVREFLNRKL
jgi:hypothetical protein